MKIKNLNMKRDQEVLRKNKEKKMSKKACTIFIQVEKWFLMPLKVKYFY